MEAMNEPDFNFHGSTASTGGSAPLMIVSGPMADDLGMNSDVNLFGPGNRANATMGRAVRLDPHERIPDDPGCVRQINPRSTRANSPSASLSAAATIPGRCWSRIRTIRKVSAASPSSRAAAFAMWRTTAAILLSKILGRGRRRDGELWLHHAWTIGGRPGAGTCAGDRSRRME